MSEIEYCAFGSRCGGCEAKGLAARTRSVMPGVLADAGGGIEGEELQTEAREWLASIDPPKNAPKNPVAVAAIASAATRIASGECTQHTII